MCFWFQEDAVKEIKYETLRELYIENRFMFDRDALRVVSSGKWKTISEVLDRKQFEPTEYSDSHIIWCVISGHNVDTNWL